MSIKEFLAERTEQGGKTPEHMLLNAYRMWAKKNHRPAVDDREFRKAMWKLGYEREYIPGGVYRWLNIRLKR